MCYTNSCNSVHYNTATYRELCYYPRRLRTQTIRAFPTTEQLYPCDQFTDVYPVLNNAVNHRRLRGSYMEEDISFGKNATQKNKSLNTQWRDVQHPKVPSEVPHFLSFSTTTLSLQYSNFNIPPEFSLCHKGKRSAELGSSSLLHPPLRVNLIDCTRKRCLDFTTCM